MALHIVKMNEPIGEIELREEGEYQIRLYPLESVVNASLFHLDNEGDRCVFLSEDSQLVILAKASYLEGNNGVITYNEGCNSSMIVLPMDKFHKFGGLESFKIKRYV